MSLELRRSRQRRSSRCRDLDCRTSCSLHSRPVTKTQFARRSATRAAARRHRERSVPVDCRRRRRSSNSLMPPPRVSAFWTCKRSKDQPSPIWKPCRLEPHFRESAHGLTHSTHHEQPAAITVGLECDQLTVRRERGHPVAGRGVLGQSRSRSGRRCSADRCPRCPQRC